MLFYLVSFGFFSNNNNTNIFNRNTKEIGCDEVIEMKEENLDATEEKKKDEENRRYYFKCGEICNKKLECGNHFCDLRCHSGPCVECKRKVQHPPICACGKTRFKKGSKAFENKRKSCLEPLALCNKKCGKLLSCNKHFCKSHCHDSACKDCNIKFRKSCRCGSESKNFNCTDYERKKHAAMASGDVCLDFVCLLF